MTDDAAAGRAARPATSPATVPATAPAPSPPTDRRGLLDALLERLDLPPGAWAYALRVWIAMMLALYVAFWLQLESASSAAVCVAILAQQRRGQALSKAFYRLLGTLVGFAASLVLVAAFGQDRVLLLGGFGLWLGLCVFVANYLPGTRGYGAMLSGYTVAIIAIANIDAPMNVFASGINRVAAITVGILTITLVNDALGAPEVLPRVRADVAAAREAVRAYVVAVVGADPGDAAPERRAALLRQIAAARTDIASLAGETDDGPDRAAGARSAVAGLFAQVAAASTFARAVPAALADGRDAPPGATRGSVEALAARVRAGLSGESAARSDLEEGARRAVADAAGSPVAALLHRRAADILREDAFVEDGMRALDGGGPPGRDVALPIHRDFPDALRNTARVVVAYALSAALFVATGWPATSTGLLQVSAFAALSAVAPDPRQFSRDVLVAMPLAVLLGAVVKFVVLAGSQGFPLLAIAMAPIVFVACFLSLDPRTFTVGFILLVFFPVVLGLSNPQDYDPQAFVDSGVLFVAASVLLFLSSRLVLPTSLAQQRRWSLDSARADILAILREGSEESPRRALGRVTVDADRLAQFAARESACAAARRAGLRHAFALAELDTAAAGAQAGLTRLAGLPDLDGSVLRARDALARADAADLRAAARGIVAAVAARGRREDDANDARDAASFAVAGLTAVAALIEREPRLLRRLGVLPGIAAGSSAASGGAPAPAAAHAR